MSKSKKMTIEEMVDCFRIMFSQAVAERSQKRKGLAPQFERAGIYAILLDGRIVYIGKSVNILARMAQHYAQLSRPKAHKYEILAEASRRGHRIRFCVLYAARSTTPAAIEEEIGEKEGEFIRRHLPPLNYQIPKAENWRQFTTNPAALTITLEEIVKNYK